MNEAVNGDGRVVDVDMEAPPIPPPQPFVRAIHQSGGNPTSLEEEQQVAGPSRPSVRPPGGERFSLVPQLQGLQGKSKDVVNHESADESFDFIDPPDELAQILDATSAAMAADEGDWAVLDEMDMDEGMNVVGGIVQEEEKSRFFGGAVSKGKRKGVTERTLSTTNEKKSRITIPSEDEAKEAQPHTTKVAKRLPRKGKEPLFDPPDEQSDADYPETDEDSQKENRPMAIDIDADKDGENGPCTRRRDAGKPRTKVTVDADDKEWREVIELSD